jgi:hypothetical protein
MQKTFLLTFLFCKNSECYDKIIESFLLKKKKKRDVMIVNKDGKTNEGE